MIQSFSDKEAKKIFEREYSAKLPTDIQRIILRKLLMLHAANSINDLRVPPGNRLERLKGNRKDEHSIRINQQWRICFVWTEGCAHSVLIQDYH
ncbi:plasmid maintenance system killer [Candidatus Uhrbacteria bacterium RIFCSPHIGHO2_12_FULL_47_12]|uniref:Plasmid maintenance system killer n=1 Tax=Candidatus Uhrbacteria bacterium RIFCSPLOWO2_02_FULL_48_18 TaxID=1802408 RepID=A0A1F7V898_9BACT|nr:MAG: plasmid maintenance system killer [Candidatus Uhrbacteria bacterium RIFCSPHIGHO2_01_FULL_47_10]OGL77131.1 MAG: plasmid maintenance system killer [Candidatus Uhrbacteria bacterium RIFCSPHIGHO2_12_FULL_47_12]OGL82210.1 MAG: plasmid maintenance system killer [Candidatus Uhrbacteria bacterium RIFCSPLOWO2_01_FULL_47_17]OGL86700.1 MAG: plasmid maintenance system killer [Candidatus Uhrbacteria bacterium RIFCSPLOWO2_02_FULL_48_18]OGL94089.1 MAG: plasmid maintenance system killer [Candidatus Uhr